MHSGWNGLKAQRFTHRCPQVLGLEKDEHDEAVADEVDDPEKEEEDPEDVGDDWVEGGKVGPVLGAQQGLHVGGKVGDLGGA